MKTNTLTVLIPCKNEQNNLHDCIESVRGLADELLVADSGSTDGTRQIARQLGCRVIEREYVNSGDFKNWAIPQARHPWVLIVDADERVTEELALEVRALLEGTPDKDGYSVFRRNHFLGHPVRHGTWGRDKVIRLFRRDIGRYSAYTDHAEVSLSRHRVGVLRGRLLHYTFCDYGPYLQKMLRYAEQQAQLWHAQGKRPQLRNLILNGPLRFARSYLLQLGFLDGLVGFQLAALTGIYSFMKQARLWQLYHQRSETIARRMDVLVRPKAEGRTRTSILRELRRGRCMLGSPPHIEG